MFHLSKAGNGHRAPSANTEKEQKRIKAYDQGEDQVDEDEEDENEEDEDVDSKKGKTMRKTNWMAGMKPKEQT